MVMLFDNEYCYTKDLFGEARGGTLIMERNNLILALLPRVPM
jgi:hypothetical protein